jgi:hypothetical protein
MARYELTADDTAAKWVVDGHVVMTADGEQAFGEWWMEDGRAGEYEDDGDTVTLYDEDGVVLATLSTEADWERWLGCNA